MSADLGHHATIKALCDCAATVTTLSYQEAIEGYFNLRGLPIPPDVEKEKSAPRGEPCWLKFLPSDKEWLADHGREMGSGVGQQAIERLLVALDHVAAEASRDDLLRQLEEAKGEVERTKNNLLDEQQAREDHLQHVSEFLSELYGVMVDPCAEGTLKVEIMTKELLAAATLHRETISTLTAQRDRLLEAGKPEVMLPILRKFIGQHSYVRSLRKEPKIGYTTGGFEDAAKAIANALRTAHEAAAQAGEAGE